MICPNCGVAMQIIGDIFGDYVFRCPICGYAIKPIRT